MKILSFDEYIKSPGIANEYEVHILVEPFGKQIFCNVNEFKRAAKVALLQGTDPAVFFTTKELRLRFGASRNRIEELMSLWR